MVFSYNHKQYEEIFWLRQGPAEWPLDVRSIGLRCQDVLYERKQGADFYFIFWTLAGSGWLDAPERHRLDPGDLFIIPQGLPHRYGVEQGRPYWLGAWFTIYGPEMESIMSSLGINRLIIKQTGLPPPAFFYRLLPALQFPGIEGNIERAQIALRLLYEISWSLKKGVCSTGSSRFQALTEWARNRLDRTMNVEALAREAGLSRFHFCREFQRASGMLPSAFIKEIKMEKAQQLLAQGRTRIQVIAEACGFSDKAHFCRYFKA